jgi:hypothetical protein
MAASLSPCNLITIIELQHLKQLLSLSGQMEAQFRQLQAKHGSDKNELWRLTCSQVQGKHSPY